MSSRKILSLAVVSAISAGCMVGRLSPPIETRSAIFDTCRTAVGSDREPVTETVAWAQPESAGDRAQLDRWCQAVGPAIVASARPRTEARAQALTIVSWNAHVGGGDVIGFVRAIRRGEIAGVAPGNDLVLLLQEAFRADGSVPSNPGTGAVSATGIRESPPSSVRTDIVTAARTLGLSLYYAPSMRNGAHGAGLDEDRGNAILSTLPLSDFRAIELPFERQRRVAVAAVVSGAAKDGLPWRLRVVSAHLDNLAPRALWIFASGARERQSRGLLGALPPDDRFSVVGSDLNTWAGGTHEGAYLALRSAFPQTEAPRYRSSGEGGLLLDYIFWRVEGRPAPNVQRIDDTYGSDHHPLVTTVSLDDLVPQQLLPVSRTH